MAKLEALSDVAPVVDFADPSKRPPHLGVVHATAGALLHSAPGLRDLQDRREQMLQVNRLAEDGDASHGRARPRVDVVTGHDERGNRRERALLKLPPAERRAIHLRHPHVEQDDVREVVLFVKHLPRDEPVVRDGDAEAFVAQDVGQGRGELRIVLDDEEATRVPDRRRAATVHTSKNGSRKRRLKAKFRGKNGHDGCRVRLCAYNDAMKLLTFFALFAVSGITACSAPSGETTDRTSGALAPAATHCIRAPLTDLTSPDCAVDQVSVLPDGTQTLAAIPECAATATLYPCWRVEIVAECAKVSPQSAGVRVYTADGALAPSGAIAVACSTLPQ